MLLPVPKAAVDLIAAAATPAGAGGIGIIRVSGDGVDCLARGILSSGRLPPARYAVREQFIDGEGRVLDDGVCIYFPAPHSFTGQDVLELHGHGGTASLREILSRCYVLGARAAEAGEFSLRAYLNGKMDLAQAEAVSDLINANTAAAARAAARAAGGEFSRRAHELCTGLLTLRADMEAAVDFSDEDTGVVEDFASRIVVLRQQTATFLMECENGARLASGMTVAIVGHPNAGKSSLFNALCGEEAAIVCAEAGTTRDIILRDVEINGVSVRLTDAAGLREDAGGVEQEGIRRALVAASTADLVLLVSEDDNEPAVTAASVLRVHNKIDTRGLSPGRRDNAVYVSAKTGEGITALQEAIVEVTVGGEAPFTARARHVAALTECISHITQAEQCGTQAEVAAAWLSSAHTAAALLTGESVDDEKVLGEIFSRFCIGK